MNSVISSYLRTSPTVSGVSEAIKNLTNILESGPTGRLSPSLLEAFLLGSSGALQFAIDTKSYNPQNVLSLLNLLQRRKFLSHNNFSIKQWDSLCSLIYELMKNCRDPQCWKHAVEILSCSESLNLISERDRLLDGLCDILIPSYEFDKPLEASCDFLAQPLYSKLLERCLFNYLAAPSISTLRIVVRLTTFGLLLVKLAPSTYLSALDQLAKTMHQASGRHSLDKVCTDGKLPLFEDVSKLSVAKTLGILLSVLPRAPCQILSLLKSLLVLFPRLAEKEERFQTILTILTHAMRLPTSTGSSFCVGEEKENNRQRSTQPAIFALRALVKLTDALSHCDLPIQMHANMMNQLFDLLRVFPANLEHAEVRLRAWWHFICRLPGDLLDEGFKRFISPFLANLLGRYLSISAPLGDPQLHRYKLSDGSAYEGNREALELTQHVFACLFHEAHLDLNMLDRVPRVLPGSILLVHNSYPLVVALLHWMRLICGHTFSSSSQFPEACLPPQPVDRIWTACIRAVLDSAKSGVSSDELPTEQPSTALRSPSMGNKPAHSTILMVLEQVVCCTCHLLLTPGCFGAPEDRPNDLPIGSPSAVQCLNIIESLTESILQYPVPSQNKTELLFDLLLKLTELGGQWIRPDTKAEVFATDDRERTLNRWCSLTIRLINLDPRLEVNDTDSLPTMSRKGGEFLRLIRQLLSALLPDCVHLAAVNHPSAEFGTQDSSLSVFLGQPPVISYSPDALRIWSELADRLTRFIVIEQLICEGDPVVRPDLSAVHATILAPFWLAGSTPSPSITIDSESSVTETNEIPPNFLSNKDELAVAKRLAHLFVTFHQEACLLTTVAANAWINQLGHALVTLISALPPQPSQHFNFNLLGRLLKCFAQNAERVQEGLSANPAFNPFTWKVTQDHPFGQLTGLLLALKHCLLNCPWLTPPSTHSQSPVRSQSAKSTARFLTSPPMIPSARRLITDDESSCIASQLTLEERIAATSYKASCGLIDALEAVIILIKNHAQEPHLLAVLVETLMPALSHLTTCCARAEDILQTADAELDEPLLITQRRQQAKHALEDVFITIWSTLGCSPVVLSEYSPVPVFRSLSKRSQNTTNQKPFKLEPHLCSGLLQVGLTLCGVGSSLPLPQRPFVLWFAGFWNQLTETCPKQGRSWELVRNSLTEHEEAVRQLLGSPRQLSQTTIDHKTPGSGRKSRGRGRKRSTDRSDKSSESLEPSSPTLATLKKEITPGKAFNEAGETPASRRPRRGRLSLNRTTMLVQQRQPTTPVTKTESPDQQKALTRSAPGKLATGRRGRPRRSMLAISPQQRSPGILASVLGIQPGVNIMESKSSWSPAAGGGSPSPLPGGRPLVKRRLFMGPSEGPGETGLALFGQRKRTLSDSESTGLKHKSKPESDVPAQPIDFEESAQFVFIPPAPDNARKRRRTLTSHQKERFEEQRKDYLPATYTELDASQQSASDSQSESQSQFSQISWDHFRPSTAIDADRTASATVTSASSTVIDLKPVDSIIDSPIRKVSDQPLPLILLSPPREPTPTPSEVPKESGTAPTSDDRITEVQQPETISEEVASLRSPTSAESSFSTSPKQISTDHISSTGEHSKLVTPTILPQKKVPSPQTPPVTLPLSNLLNRASPLMRGPSSSRAQRMLALGLQKAAEQTARQKLTDSAPSTPERRLSPSANSPFLKTPLGAESPSGIMRNLASRKKAQRVSFAAQPVVYTFGSPTPDQSQSTLPSPSPSEAKPLPTEKPITIDLQLSKPSSLDATILGKTSQPSNELVIDVDLDTSQSIQPSQVSSPSMELPSPTDDSLQQHMQHRRRKSSSPHRLVITPRSNLVTSPSRKKESKLDNRRTSVVKRRRLFIADSPEADVEPPATVVLETEPEDLQTASVSPSRPLVVDSEPIEIEDTQSSQTPAAPTASKLAPPEPVLEETQEECELIESSQGTQESSEQAPTSPEPLPAITTESVVDHTPPLETVSPAVVSEQVEPKCTTDRPLFISQSSLDEHPDVPTEVSSTDEEDRSITNTSKEHTQAEKESDAEQFIRQSLSQIAEKLTALTPAQYQVVLMEALSTFKPLMR